MKRLVVLALLLTALATPREEPRQSVSPAERDATLAVSLPASAGALRGAPLGPEASLRATFGAPITGNAGYAVPSLGRDYLAMRLPRGTHVLIVGPGGSWQAVVNDYGPSSHIRPSRIADIALVHWLAVCAAPRKAGLCRVRVYVGGHEAHPTPHRTAPPTDTGP